MKITKARFRILLFLMTLSGVGGGVVSFVGSPSLPSELQTFIHRSGGAAMDLRVMLAIGVVGLVLALVTILGLFFFWKPAKFLLLVLSVFGIIISPFLGPTVEPALTTTLYELSEVFSGMVIAVLFFGSSEYLFGSGEVQNTAAIGAGGEKTGRDPIV